MVDTVLLAGKVFVLASGYNVVRRKVIILSGERAVTPRVIKCNGDDLLLVCGRAVLYWRTMTFARP